MERKGWPMTILRKLDEVFLSYKYDEVFSPTKHDEVFFSPVLTSKYTFPSLTVAKESRAHKRRNYAIYELLFSF